MSRLDIVSEITSRLSGKVGQLYVAVAPDTAKVPFCVVRQDDPRDTKTKDAIVSTRCDVQLLCCGAVAAQVAGMVGTIGSVFNELDADVNGCRLSVRADTPGKVDADGEGMVWQDVLLRVVVRY